VGCPGRVALPRLTGGQPDGAQYPRSVRGLIRFNCSPMMMQPGRRCGWALGRCFVDLCDKQSQAPGRDIPHGAHRSLWVCLAEGHLQKLATCTRAEQKALKAPPFSSDRFPSPASTAIGSKNRESAARSQHQTRTGQADPVRTCGKTAIRQHPGEDPLPASRSAMDRIPKEMPQNHRARRGEWLQ